MNRNCPLYALKSKKQLKLKLKIADNKYIKDRFQDDINIFIDRTMKPRLIEAPCQELKHIQSNIKNCLHMCDFPDYVFSGVKNKTYLKNAYMHKDCKYMFKADISAFFPNVSRNTIYEFFKYDLNTSSDIAKILTDICTVNIAKSINNDEDVKEFVAFKNIRQKHHLCTGSPASPLLSYLANKKMFDELKNIADTYNYVFTIYVDDVFFSSLKPIPNSVQKRIIKTITKYGYNISKSKVTYYKPQDYKKVTGVIISPDNKLLVPNKLKRKIVNSFSKGKYTVSEQSMQGMLFAARKIEDNIFSGINNHLLNSKKERSN
ncbi:MAG: reverse transcriptase family protein [Eubacterium sp.]|nr:reverse transcriptase family protein [Eubacterium sp.]